MLHDVFCAYIFNIIITADPESRDNAVGISTDYGLDDQGVGVRTPVGGKNFNFSMSSRPALGPIQPTIQWVPESLSQGL
jgi:hypothetical protein